MYEVGVALACRHPSEVLLIRDDEDEFLFDVSSIPHMKLDFTRVDEATSQLSEALTARLRERQLINDARVELAIAGLTNEEAAMLRQAADYSPTAVWGRKQTGSIDFFGMAALPRLLDKQLIRVSGEFEEGHPAYSFTPLGRVVAQHVKEGLRKFKATPPREPDATAGESQPS